VRTRGFAFSKLKNFDFFFVKKGNKVFLCLWVNAHYYYGRKNRYIYIWREDGLALYRKMKIFAFFLPITIEET